MTVQRIREIENELRQDFTKHSREYSTDEVFALIDVIVSMEIYKKVTEREEIRRAATQAD